MHSRIPTRARSVRNVASAAATVIAVSACLNLVTSAAHAATLARSVVVSGTPSQVWGLIGPFCSIKDWLPPVGSCTESGKPAVVRTLVTRDGRATFVERQVARSDANHSYSYVFVSSPLPVSHYQATIEVTPLGQSQSVVTWRASYTPNAGRDADANDALRGIYETGLASIQAQAARLLAPATPQQAAP